MLPGSDSYLVLHAQNKILIAFRIAASSFNAKPA